MKILTQSGLSVCLPLFPHENVHIVGAGGIGSRLVPLVAQFMGTYCDPEKATLTLWDPDTVEEKNLSRQNFVRADVGKYKADVLSKRYGIFFPIISRDASWRGTTAGRTTVLLCIDSRDSRMTILRACSESTWPGVFVIDGGNEATFGQVAQFTAANPSQLRDRACSPVCIPDKFLLDHEVIPVPWKMYERVNGAEGTPMQHLSCGEMEQSMSINVLIAAGMFANFQHWHFGNPVLNVVNYYSTEGMSSKSDTIADVLEAEGLIRNGEEEACADEGDEDYYQIIEIEEDGAGDGDGEDERAPI